MNRYHVFAYDTYYPTGGWNDHIAATDDREQAMGIARSCLDGMYRLDHVQVVDFDIEEVIAYAQWDPDPRTAGTPQCRRILVERK